MADINWIRSPQTADWENLSQELMKDNLVLHKLTFTLEDSADRYWDNIPPIIDLCPKKYNHLLFGLALAYVVLESRSKYFRKTFPKLEDMLNPVLNCPNEVNKDVFIKGLFYQWDRPSLPPTKSIIDTVFDPEVFLYVTNNPERYEKIVNIVYKIMPDAVAAFFKAEAGQFFWFRIKRLQSAGIISQKSVQLIDNIAIGQLGLPMIEFEPVDMDKIFTGLGWKRMGDVKEAEKVKIEDIADVVGVGDLCYLTKPCKHDVTFMLKTGEQKTETKSWPEIVHIYNHFQKKIPLTDH
jgi:hypothetical protein